MEANSQNDFYLEPGAHKITIVSVGTPVYASPNYYMVKLNKHCQFGKITDIDVELGKFSTIDVVYKAPFLIWQKGKTRITPQHSNQ